MSNKLRPKSSKRSRRSYRGPNFVQLFRYVLDSKAYISLSANARSALIEVNRGYNGVNNGAIVLSVRSIAERMGCHIETASCALQELVKKGFIEERVKGSYSVKFRRATEWRLTDRRCDVTGVEQSQAFLKWQNPDPEPKSKPKSQKRKPQYGKSVLYSTEKPYTGNFSAPPPQYGKTLHCEPLYGTENPYTSISTNLERAVVLPAAVLSDDGVEPTAAEIGHNAGPPLDLPDNRPSPAAAVPASAAAAPDDLLDIPPFLRRR
jgi:DNA-binding MarR family transcriptional regulator